MTYHPHRNCKREAAALVEMAAIVSVFLLLLFGMLEYCRYMFIRQLVANAAREGARFAVVNTYSDTVDADTKAHVEKYMGGVDGRLKNFVIQVYRGDSNGDKVYAYDASGQNSFAYQTDATGKYLQTSGGSKIYIQSDGNGAYVPDSGSKVYVNLDSDTQGVTGVNATSWNSFTSNQQIKGVESASTAAFGEYIVVQIDCEYDSITPSLLFLGNTISLSSRGMMYSEAN